jgi:excisionase family DNA binding protein
MPRKRHITRRRKPAQRAKPPKPARDPHVFTIPELAARWRASRHTISVAIQAGRLQAFKVGDRHIRILEAEVLRYEQQNMAAAS